MRFIGVDPSTKTGFVVLDERGSVITAKVITGIGDEDPRRMVTMIDDILEHIKFYYGREAMIGIEGFPFNSPQAIQLGGIGWMLRGMLWRKLIGYQDVAPLTLKSYIGVTGWKGEKGSKERLKGPEKKKAVADAVRERWGFENKSTDIVDAYVIAQIMREKHLKGLGK